jgi:hypothetical protein
MLVGFTMLQLRTPVDQHVNTVSASVIIGHFMIMDRQYVKLYWGVIEVVFGELVKKGSRGGAVG